MAWPSRTGGEVWLALKARLHAHQAQVGLAQGGRRVGVVRFERSDGAASSSCYVLGGDWVAIKVRQGPTANSNVACTSSRQYPM